MAAAAGVGEGGGMDGRPVVTMAAMMVTSGEERDWGRERADLWARLPLCQPRHQNRLSKLPDG